MAEPAPAAGLTAVIVSLVGGEALARCRAALAGADEVLVVGRAAGAEGAQPAGIESVPAMRAWALRGARTPFVALVEDTALPAPGWCAAARAALAGGAAAAAGPVRVSPELAPRHQALGLTEYAAFGPAPPEPGRRLPGLGFAVERAAVLALPRKDPDLLLEAEVAGGLAAAGRAIVYSPALGLEYAAAYPEGARLSTRFSHGRLYAAGRVARRGAGARAAYAAGSLLLPILLTFRTLGSSRGRLGPATLAWVLAMQSAWAAGELVGSATGDPGAGLASWR
jgi:hypothetical protein